MKVLISVLTLLLVMACGNATTTFKYVGCSATQTDTAVLIKCPDGTVGVIPLPTPEVEPTATPKPSTTPKPSPTPKNKGGHK